MSQYRTDSKVYYYRIPQWGSYPAKYLKYTKDRASLVAQMVKKLPAVWETWVQSLGGEDPLEKGTATHSSILD